MSSDKQDADRALAEALERTGARDPRELARERLRELKHNNQAAYEDAVVFYQETLVPTVAGGDADPLLAWTQYGLKLAELTAPGRAVTIDTAGRSVPYEAPAPPEALLLHLPEAQNQKALVVGLPPELTGAQRAAYDWLVAGRRNLAD